MAITFKTITLKKQKSYYKFGPEIKEILRDRCMKMSVVLLIFEFGIKSFFHKGPSHIETHGSFLKERYIYVIFVKREKEY